MSSETSKYLKFGGATVLILMMLGYLAYTGVQESKSYYVTIKELHGMGDGAYTKRLRVSYAGSEPPPDTFKDNSQALAEGSFGQDGVFHAKALQAKCASKYAPAKPGDPASGTPNSEPPKSMTEREGSKVGVTL